MDFSQVVFKLRLHRPDSSHAEENWTLLGGESEQSGEEAEIRVFTKV